MGCQSFFGLTPLLFAEEPSALYPGFPAIEESRAYQKLIKRRRITDQAKILYLIDRFAEADIQVVYDNHYYDSAFAAKFARWFLFRFYHKQIPREWVLRWCNKSVPEGNLIWVKLPDESLRLSREVLLEEQDRLDRLLAARPKR